MGKLTVPPGRHPLIRSNPLAVRPPDVGTSSSSGAPILASAGSGTQRSRINAGPIGVGSDYVSASSIKGLGQALDGLSQYRASTLEALAMVRRHPAACAVPDPYPATGAGATRAKSVMSVIQMGCVAPPFGFSKPNVPGQPHRQRRSGPPVALLTLFRRLEGMLHLAGCVPASERRIRRTLTLHPGTNHDSTTPFAPRYASGRSNRTKSGSVRRVLERWGSSCLAPMRWADRSSTSGMPPCCWDSR